MRARQFLCLACAALLALPLLASAEIYKWKDKNGEVRYSDTPPPSNIKQESIGRKKVVKPTSQAPLSPVSNGKENPVPAAAKPASEGPSAEDEAAEQRQRNAEIEKKNKQEMEAQAKLKAENCKAAKANHETYAQGGRVYKTNEKGEREYMSDKDLQEGAQKTQAEMDEYCN